MKVKHFLCRLSLLVSFIVLVAFSFVPPAYATIGNPNSIYIESVKAYRGLWESGDMLFVVEYNLNYTTDPAEHPEDTFLVGIWNGTIKGPDRPLNYYQYNFNSIYLTAAQVASFGYSFNQELKVRIVGNPSYFPTLTEGVNMRTVTLTAGNWNEGSSIAETRLYLADWCIVLAKSLEDAWGNITLLSSGDKLNSVGMVKFKEAIPGLDSICPSIFQVSSAYPEYTEPTYNTTYQDTLTSREGTRLSTALEGLGVWVTGKSGMGSVVGGFGLAILFFVLAGRIFIATHSVPVAIAVSIPFLFVGNVIGILSLTITFIAAFMAILMFGVTFILGRLG